MAQLRCSPPGAAYRSHSDGLRPGCHRHGVDDSLRPRPADRVCEQAGLQHAIRREGEDHPALAKILPLLERKVGRIVVNGFTTGVEVGNAMVHGGPFPATSDARATSVGSLAINRFLRPVCYQDMPDDLLPNTLKRDNPLRIRRLVDGKFAAEDVLEARI